MKNSSLACFVLLATALTSTWASRPMDAKVDTKIASLDEARCKKDVNQYIETLQFVNQTAGKDVGDKVMSKYVSIDQLGQLVSNSGYCPAAKLLKEKQAFR
jgi:hypothetical protein